MTINKQTKNKHEDIVKSVDKDLDLRDRWLGTRGMTKKQCQPMSYIQKDKHGKHIPMNKRAEFAAEYWADEIWNKNKTEHIDNFLRDSIHNNQSQYRIDSIEGWELEDAIKNLKEEKQWDQMKYQLKHLKNWTRKETNYY